MTPEYPRAEALAGGRRVVFRALAAHETQACALAAARAGSGEVANIERGIQLLARAIVSIDGRVLPEVDPDAMWDGDEAQYTRAVIILNDRVHELYRYSSPLLCLLSDAWIAVQAQFLVTLSASPSERSRWN